MTRILVIDDDEEIRSLLRNLLERYDFEVDEAADGVTGVELFRENPANIVITDIFLPKKSGINVIRELRKEFPEVKIVAISGAGGGSLGMGSVVHIGADKYLQKPFHIDEIIQSVQELVEINGTKPGPG